jgi:hypothetical protein
VRQLPKPVDRWTTRLPQRKENRVTRFQPTVESLTASLEWHARVTTELQSRVTEAQKYIRGRINDPQLERILNGAAPEEEHDGFDHCQGCQAAYQSREGAIG